MTEFELNIQNIYGKKGKEWLSHLPKRVIDIASRFNLRELVPMPNLAYNYVLSGFQGAVPVVLKLGVDGESLLREAFALKNFAGFGVVKVVGAEDGFLLLEKATPGTSLKTYFPYQDSDAVKITCNVIKKLHQAGIPTNHNFPHIKDWLSTLDKNWELPEYYLQKARKLRDQLLATSGPDVLLHGDLHHDNILKNGDEWIVIDPKGIIGDPTYEVAAFIRNPLPELLMSVPHTDIIQRRVHNFSEILDTPTTRIADWNFVQAVLSWAFALQDKGATEYWEQIITAFDGKTAAL